MTEALATVLAGLVRRRGPEHAIHRPSGLQGDGRAGRLHAGHRRSSSAEAPRWASWSWLIAILPEAAVAPCSSSSDWRSPPRRSWRRPRGTAPPWPSLRARGRGVVLIEVNGLLAALGTLDRRSHGRGAGAFQDSPRARQRLHPHRDPVGHRPSSPSSTAASAPRRSCSWWRAGPRWWAWSTRRFPSGALFWPWAPPSPVDGQPGRDLWRAGGSCRGLAALGARGAATDACAALRRARSSARCPAPGVGGARGAGAAPSPNTIGGRSPTVRVAQGEPT